MLILEILLKGYLFLFSAIIFNIFMGIFKIKSWYYLLNNFKNPHLKTLDIIFLFILYPIFLGAVVILLDF
jgi:hypothetical protein